VQHKFRNHHLSEESNKVLLNLLLITIRTVLVGILITKARGIEWLYVLMMIPTTTLLAWLYPVAASFVILPHRQMCGNKSSDVSNQDEFRSILRPWDRHS
jgi:hypothetical protein